MSSEIVTTSNVPSDTDARILAAVMEIWYARAKPVDTNASEYMTRKLLELNEPADKIIAAVLAVAESTEQWPNLGQIKELICPSAKTIIDRELQIVYEWSIDIRSQDTIPAEIVAAANRVGGIAAHRSAPDDYLRRAWETRYRSARESVMRGDPAPVKTKPLLVEPPTTEKYLTAEEIAEKRKKYGIEYSIEKLIGDKSL